MADRGLTLAELVISLVLMGLTGTAVGRVVIIATRFHRLQTERAQIHASLRAGMTFLQSELRELNAGDSAGSDLVEMSLSSLTYKGMRSTSFLCRSPHPTRPQITVSQTPFFGLRRLDAARDSILVLAENDPSTPVDDVWLHADVVSIATGKVCPGDTRGARIVLGGLTQAALAGVDRGAAVRGFQVTRVLLYKDARGQSWLGVRDWKKGTGWSTTQPVLGPLAPDGLRFEYYDSAGNTTVWPSAVARIGMTLVGAGSRRITSFAGQTTVLRDSLVTHVALRNNPRY